LAEKGGLYGNLGENQIAEVMNCARVAVFFLDEDQKVTWRDIGDVAEIERWAQSFGAAVHHMTFSRSSAAQALTNIFVGWTICWESPSNPELT
jgi:hypothetical protein